MRKTVITKRLTCCLAAVPLCVLVSLGSGARAQTAEPNAPSHKPLSLKFGVFLPSNRDVKDSIGNRWYSVGADYAFNRTASQKLMPVAFLDYAAHSKEGIKGDYIGVGGGLRYYLSPSNPKGVTPYIGAGIGTYFLYASGYDNTVAETRIGYKLNVSLEFQQRYLLEANYTTPGSADGVRIDGFNLLVGFRL